MSWEKPIGGNSNNGLFCVKGMKEHLFSPFLSFPFPKCCCCEPIPKFGMWWDRIRIAYKFESKSFIIEGQDFDGKVPAATLGGERVQIMNIATFPLPFS